MGSRPDSVDTVVGGDVVCRGDTRPSCAGRAPTPLTPDAGGGIRMRNGERWLMGVREKVVRR